jgi:hypothetical protein
VKERRSIGRLPVIKVMRPISARFEAGLRVGQGRVSDLAPAGLFVATEDLPEPDERVYVSFAGPTGIRIEVQGTVRWTSAERPVEPAGFGMQIEDPPPEYSEFFEWVRMQIG